MKAERLGLGVVGCGGIAQAILKECVGLDCLAPVAAFDPHPQNLSKVVADFGCEPEESFESLLERKGVQAVLLSAPPTVRPAQAFAAARAGKAVFSEKPLALSVAEGRRVVEACREAGSPLMVGQVLRYFGGFGRLADHVLSGALGKPLMVESRRYGPPFPANYRDAWRLRKGNSGGLLFEVHVHELDYSRHLCGDPISVFAKSRRVGTDPETDYEDLHVGIIEFESGAFGQFHFSQISPRGETCVTVFCERGVAWAGFASARWKGWDGEEADIPILETHQEPAYRKELRLFAEAVLRGEPMPITGEDGLWAVAMAEGFERSAARGEAVGVKGVF